MLCPKCGAEIPGNISNTFPDLGDGKTYKTVNIGGRVWMAENLDYAGNGGVYYNDVADPPFEKAGRLYTWQQATDEATVPSGWHLPNNSEWETLMNFVGGFIRAGLYLKATNGWDNHDGNFGSGTDKYGFAALPSGSGIVFKANNSYSGRGGFGYWWSAAEVDVNRAYYYRICYSRDGAYLEGNHQKGLYKNKNHLYSVRCIRD